MLTSWMRKVVLAFLLAQVVLVGNCTLPRTLTAAEVETLGKRPFPGRTQAELVKAAGLALRTLGFDVVMADPSTGRVKTAPKTMVVQAAGGYGRAMAISNEVAWTLEITPSSGGVVVQAIPRASAGGQSYDGPWDAAYIEKSMSDLFKEIESDLGAPSKASEAKSEAASSSSKAAEAKSPPSKGSGSKPARR